MKNQHFDVVVVGGGISGLYCAWVMGRTPARPRVLVLEGTNRWGGRIETGDMAGFRAEYGPMRYGLRVQPRFAALLAQLNLKPERFVPTSPGDIDFPKFDLEPDEGYRDGDDFKQYDALVLLKLGCLRLHGHQPSGHPVDDPSWKAAQSWIDRQGEAEYGHWRRTMRFDQQAMHDLGFWNALSGVLSHQALMKIRDSGTFYHMLPDNLNAVEWLIWWLRASKTAARELSGIEGGSRAVIDALRDRLGRLPNVVLRPRQRVIDFASAGGSRVVVAISGAPRLSTDRLILAVPRTPLKRLAGSLPAQIRTDLDGVNGFPMIKVFFVTNDPWWNERTPPQTGANRMPTREVHYWWRRTKEAGGVGMAMLYTDRPATEYWRHYVAGASHDEAEVDGNPHLRRQFARWLAKDAIAHYRATSDEASLPASFWAKAWGLDKAGGDAPDEEAVLRAIEDSVVTYSIRDWAREPYGAANHCWQPGVKSWEVMERFAAFALREGGPKNVHIVGEAYSDYTGFIEGALRTSDAALTAIRGQEEAGTIASAGSSFRDFEAASIAYCARDDDRVNLAVAENVRVFPQVSKVINEQNSLRVQDTKYPQSGFGTPELLGRIADFFNVTQRFAPRLTAAHVTGFASTRAVLAHTIAPLVAGVKEPVFLLPTPYWHGFHWVLKDWLGGPLNDDRIVHVDRAPGRRPGGAFPLTLAALQDAYEARPPDRKPHALVLTNPDNPLGSNLAPDLLEDIATWVLEETDMHLVSDEIYAHSHTADATPFRSLLACRSAIRHPARAHVAWGFAKDFGVSGFRIGAYLCRDVDRHEVARETAMWSPFDRLHAYMMSAVLGPGGRQGAEIMTVLTRELTDTHRAIARLLDTNRIPYHRPGTSGLFFWLDLREWLGLPCPRPGDHAAEQVLLDAAVDDREGALAACLGDRAKVSITPGRNLYCAEPGFFRACYTGQDPRVVLAAFQSIVRVLNQMRGK